jgi:hypothetical protein
MGASVGSGIAVAVGIGGGLVGAGAGVAAGAQAAKTSDRTISMDKIGRAFIFFSLFWFIWLRFIQ